VTGAGYIDRLAPVPTIAIDLRIAMKLTVLSGLAAHFRHDKRYYITQLPPMQDDRKSRANRNPSASNAKILPRNNLVENTNGIILISIGKN
jgi:hypothetical protein